MESIYKTFITKIKTFTVKKPGGSITSETEQHEEKRPPIYLKILIIIFLWVIYAVVPPFYFAIHQNYYQNKIIDQIKLELDKPYIENGIKKAEEFHNKKDIQWIKALYSDDIQSQKEVTAPFIRRSEKEIIFDFISIFTFNDTLISHKKTPFFLDATTSWANRVCRIFALKAPDELTILLKEVPELPFWKFQKIKETEGVSLYSAWGITSRTASLVMFGESWAKKIKNGKAPKIYIIVSSKAAKNPFKPETYLWYIFTPCFLFFGYFIIRNIFKRILSKKPGADNKNEEKTKTTLFSHQIDEQVETVKPVNDAQPGKGTVIGPYVLQDSIGSGGFASVWRASKNGEQGEYAIKIPHSNLSKEDQNILNQLFDREKDISRELKHPNILYVYPDNLPEKVLVMEYVKGYDLSFFLKAIREKDRKISMEIFLFIAQEICRGLKECDLNNVVHRDIKPSNIIVSLSGDVKIGDFGIAKHLITSQTPLKTIGGRKYTPAYASPEQFLSDPQNAATHQSDIYSLGLIFYEMISKKNVKDIDPIIRKMEPISPLNNSVSDVPDSLNNIVMKCVEKKVTDRYERCRELFKDIYDLRSEGYEIADKTQLAAFIGELFPGQEQPDN